MFLAEPLRMMEEKRLYLVLGLGNPGDAYKNTRHNAGFMVVDALAEEFSVSCEKKKFDALLGRGKIDGAEVILAKPMSYMNRSGVPACGIMNYFGISARDMVVIHDDIDLGFGRIKIKEKGGHGGHKGIKSLTDTLGSSEFSRLRIGMGRPDAGKDVADYVLGRFSHEESKILPEIIRIAADAVVTILCKGTKEGMNRFNGKSISLIF